MFNLFAATVWETPTPVRQGTNLEWSRYGAETADGCMIYVWSDTKRGDRDIYAQKVSSTGALLWAEPVLIGGNPGKQAEPVIIRTTANLFIIAWVDYSTGDLSGDVYAQEINAAGQIQWPLGGKIVCNATGTQKNLNIEPDATNGAYIVWEDNRNPSTDLYGQHINSLGFPHWNPTGLVIAGATGDEIEHTMWKDGTGGIIIGYKYNLSSTASYTARRISVDGGIVWTLALCDFYPHYELADLKMSPIDINSFVFTWTERPWSFGKIIAQRVSRNGLAMWAAPIEVYSDTDIDNPTIQSLPRIMRTSDDCVIIAWEDRRNSPEEADLYAQKINPEGSPVWGMNAVALTDADYRQNSLRLVSDNAGGCFATWNDYRDGNYQDGDVYAQHLSSTGVSLWAADGISIDSATGDQLNPHIRFNNNNVYIAWQDAGTGSMTLKYQVLSPNGVNQLELNGRQVFGGISGSADYNNYKLLARSGDAVAIWLDDRATYHSNMIYYQIINADGSVELTTNGRAVSLPTGNAQGSFDAIVLPNDQIAIVWEEGYTLKAQLIDADGERLWGDFGIPISAATTLRAGSPRLSYEDGAIYIGWSSLSSFITPNGEAQLFRIYAQKIVNGQLLWGDGVLVSQSLAGDEMFDSIMSQLTGRYFTWVRYSLLTGCESVYIKLLNPDGSTAAGWAEQGIASSTYDDWDLYQVNPRTTLTSAGIFVCWEDLRTDFAKTLYGQLISPTGVRLWDNTGMPLCDLELEQDQYNILGGNDITLCWREAVSGYQAQIKAQKYSLNGTPMWGDAGLFITNSNTEVAQGACSLARFANGGMVISWQNVINPSGLYYYNVDIYMRYLNPDGTLTGAGEGTVVYASPDFQSMPRLAVVGNEAYLAWADSDVYYDPTRCGEEDAEYYGLYVQKLSNEYVAIEDEILPGAAITLQQNYPNPCNPTTKISYSLSSAGAAELTVYNLKGQKVKTLVMGRQEKGNHTFTWDGRDEYAHQVSSGVYFYRLAAGKSQLTRKMIMLR